MAIQSQPSRIPEPFAGSGTKNTIPATNTTPSASQAASWASGFPPECSQPISAGGCPVPRDDVNGALNQLSQDFAFRQDGGIWEWSALADYDLQRIVRGSDGIIYFSVAQSGPGTAAGAQDPTADSLHVYWASPKIPTMPADDSSSAAASTAWVSAWYADRIIPSDVYVDAVNGDDANDGFSAATAKQTIAAMEAFLATPGLFQPVTGITVHVASGTYSENISGVSGLRLHYVCASTVTLNNGVVVRGSGGGSVVLSGTIVCKNVLFAASSGRIELGGDASGQSLSLTFNGVSSSAMLFVQTGSTIQLNYNASSVAIAFTNGCNASNATVRVVSLSAFIAGTAGNVLTWSGTVTGGRRYNVTQSSLLTSIGSGTAIPGASAGNVDSTSTFS